MSRTFHNRKFRKWLKNRTGYDPSCRHGGGCQWCISNRTFIRGNDRRIQKYGLKSTAILKELSDD